MKSRKSTKGKGPGTARRAKAGKVATPKRGGLRGAGSARKAGIGFKSVGEWRTSLTPGEAGNLRRMLTTEGTRLQTHYAGTSRMSIHITEVNIPKNQLKVVIDRHHKTRESKRNHREYTLRVTGLDVSTLCFLSWGVVKTVR